MGLKDTHNDIDNCTQRNLLDLPDALLTLIISKLLSSNDLTSLCSASAVCRALRGAARSALAACTHLGPPRTACAAALPAVLPWTQALTSLDLRAAFAWVDDAVLPYIAAVGTLASLTLDHCQRITAQGITALCTGRLTKLQSLSLRSLGDIGPGCPLGRGGLPALARLDLAWCHSVRGQALLPLCPQLEGLVLHGCELVGDEVCGALPRVAALSLAFTRAGDGGLAALAAGSPALARLELAARADNLWTTGSWSEGGLREFARRRPGVALVLVA